MLGNEIDNESVHCNGENHDYEHDTSLHVVYGWVDGIGQAGRRYAAAYIGRANVRGSTHIHIGTKPSFVDELLSTAWSTATNGCLDHPPCIMSLHNTVKGGVACRG